MMRLVHHITRRSFALAMTAGALAAANGSAPRIAITIDDFLWKQIPSHDPLETNRRFLDTLARHSNLQAAFFVCGQWVDNDTGRRLVQACNDAGHWIGNHSYSHLHYGSPDVTFAAFSDDLLRGERVLKGFPQFQKLFRFPYLKEGDTAQQRDQMRAFLRKHGYRNGHVTIDTSDWYYDQRLREHVEKNPSADTRPYRDAYLAHVWDRATYYDSLARQVTGRAIPHTILLHYTLLNSLFLDDVITMLESKGWQLVPARVAYADPVFSNEPHTVPAGESLIWAMAKASGKFEGKLRYPAEDGEYEKDKLDRLGL